MTPTVEAQSPNHWTAREVPLLYCIVLGSEKNPLPVQKLPPQHPETLALIKDPGSQCYRRDLSQI